MGSSAVPGVGAGVVGAVGAGVRGVIPQIALAMGFWQRTHWPFAF